MTESFSFEPRTATGKVQKYVLREQVQENSQSKR
jgi:hypothetical protein